MGRPGIKIGVLTSSRADYGIYLPLLKVLHDDPGFSLELLVFGTHLSEKHGMSINQIREDGFPVLTMVDTLPVDDTPDAIAISMAKTITGFAGVWGKRNYDYIIALGDRYEMFAAVASSVPFNIKIAHIHGGETTRGAIDNSFRHSITHMSWLHFAACEQYAEKIRNMIDDNQNNIFNVGALSIESLMDATFYTPDEFLEKFSIDITEPYLLVTFHPETIGFNENRGHIRELISALAESKDYRIIVTMPNADTGNEVIRESLINFSKSDKRVKLVENFGPRAYLTCMKYCSLMVGNSSSGFIEASYFPKPVVNLGRRQEGRVRTPNIIDCEIRKDSILAGIEEAGNFSPGGKVEIYGRGNSSSQIVGALKYDYSKREKHD